MDTFWLSCLGHFEKELSAQQFNTWIKPLYLDSSHDASEPVLVAPNRFVMQWVKDNFLSRIELMAEKYFSQNIRFQLMLAEQVSAKPAVLPAEQCDGRRNATSLPLLIPSRGCASRKTPGDSKEKNPSRLNSSFTFNNFVTGKANQLARAGAIQVAERPGVAYNPFFHLRRRGSGKNAPDPGDRQSRAGAQ